MTVCVYSDAVDCVYAYSHAEDMGTQLLMMVIECACVCALTCILSHIWYKDVDCQADDNIECAISSAV